MITITDEEIEAGARELVLDLWEKGFLMDEMDIPEDQEAPTAADIDRVIIPFRVAARRILTAATSAQPSPEAGEVEDVMKWLEQEAEAAGELGEATITPSQCRRHYEREQKLRKTIDLLQSLSARVPEGWQLVPKEPTEEMKAAGVYHYGRLVEDANNGVEDAHDAELLVVTCFRAMLASTPKQED